MKTDLDHLPSSKQRELAHVVRVLFDEFESATTRSNGFGKVARIFKIVLYGSYARGDWVSDPVGGYASDYDILIVVSHDKLTDFVDYWSAADDRLMRDATITGALSAPVNFIVHTLKDVNRQLEHGRPFFGDIVRQGITLYEAEGHPFAQPRNLPPEEAHAEAQRYFDEWYSTASEFAAGAEFHRARSSSKLAAFNFHQATERFYHTVLLVLTLYSPKSHRLNFLRSHCEEIAPELIAAWPREDKFSRRCFELVRLAYVNARYSHEYRLTDEEIGWIAERVAVLETLVREVCERRLAQP
ncbi:HEPN domain-containing protein [Sphingomonas glacialis]|uniref:HEPN domain-containing protein n=1 Tax=Sphingomonas glacialis TaxID=658225 RepID=A0A502FS86_9SPHN|nr:HEPN domain-containing protein [Sphingomonas glacialis]TPG52240.1 HEPN domain-containing protein [Sphingomonas glacialis]